MKRSKALMLKLLVKDSKTSVSDTTSTLQALVSIQYQNKTAINWRARVHHVQTQTKHKPPSRRQGAVNAGKQRDQRNSKHCQNYLHELFADSLPARATGQSIRLVVLLLERVLWSFIPVTTVARCISGSPRSWQVAQTCATPLSRKRHIGVPCYECR